MVFLLMISTSGDNVLPDVQVQATPITQTQAVIPQGTSQWLRRWSLTVWGTQTGGPVLELSAGVGGPGQNTATSIPITNPQGQILSEGLRMQFQTFALDGNEQTFIPNHAVITVYNLSNATARRVQNKEFSYVVLQAGYSNGRYGVIFNGQIKMTKRGRRSAVDTYLIIYAADGDFALNQQPLDPIVFRRGSELKDRVNGLQQQIAKNGVDAGELPSDLPGGVLPRGKVLNGAANAGLDVTSRGFFSWSIQKGKLQYVKPKGYLPGEAIVLNAHSGLIGMPEVTEQGVFVTALLNPAAKVRGLLKINNGDIKTGEPAAPQVTGFSPGAATTGGLVTGYPSPSSINAFASTDDDGTYVIFYVEYEGDTRGTAWYMKIMCLLLNAATAELIAGADPTPQSVDQAFDNSLSGGQGTPAS